MNFLLTANLTAKTFNDGNGAWSPPVFTFGEQVTIALRLARNSGGAVIEDASVVASMKAAIGNVDARPTGGTWKLKLGNDDESGSNTTAVLQADVSAAALASAINALSAMVTAYGAATVVSVNGSLLLTFAHGTEVPLTVVDNRLWPVSLGNVTAWQRDGVWVHELRLVQTPVAFTSASSLVLPPSPVITRVSSGGNDSSSLISWNEVQALYVPFEFRGTYYLAFGFARTSELTLADTPTTIAAALNQLANGFTVTSTLFQTANIEFVNDLSGKAQDLLTVTVASNPPGDLTFTLPLDRQELAAMLRNEAQVTLPLEITLVLTLADSSTQVVKLVQEITIQRTLNLPVLEETPEINWLRPLSPKNYVAYDATQTLVGQHFYPATVGDGAATTFVITHGLGTLVVRTFVNSQATGAQLIEGTHYSVVINDANSVTVTALSGAPALNAWLIIVMSAQSIAAFATDLTIEQSQVDGLLDWEAGIGAIVGQLQTLLPSQASVAGTTLNQGAFTIAFPPAGGVLFTTETDITKLATRAPYMLPAVISDSVSALPVDPLPSPAAGSVWLNETGSGIIIPGGGMIRSATVPDEGNVASDGRSLWPARRRGTTDTYFPMPFEVLLFDAFINDLMFGVGKTLTLQMQIALQLVNATSHAQWEFVIEKGTAPREADPTAAAIDITTSGTGTHTATTETVRTIGAFTANASTDVITLAAHGLNDGDVILVASTGTLPGGLAANTLYVLRDVTTNTFKVAAVATAQNLRDVIWDTVNPLVRQQLIMTPALITHQLGATITRSNSGITANAVIYNNIRNANAGAPITAAFGLRGRFMDFDTENSVPAARGWVSWQLLNPSSGILGISIA